MGYKPWGVCEDLIYSREPEVLISGPAGTGKSLACLWKLYAIACKYSGCRLLIVRKTRASLTESILVTLESDVLGKQNPLAAGPSRPLRHTYKFPRGSEIIIGGMDNADRIMSTQYDVIYAAEATELHEDDWEKLATRLRNNVVPYQQIIADCNPNAPSHWLKQRCDRGVCKILESRHEDNPVLYDHDASDWTADGIAYLHRLESLTGVRRERLRFGRWVAAEGVVYDAWDARVNICDRFDIPESWRRIRAIDFGFSNPFVCLWLAADCDGVVYVYRYTYRTKQLVEDHAMEIKRLTGREVIEATVADHDAEGNATLMRHGVPTINAKKPILTGIEAVQKRLRPDDRGVPRLFVMRDSLVQADRDLVDEKKPYTIEQEFDSYAWPRRVGKELPIDADNHALDALRYGIMYLDAGPTRFAPIKVSHRDSRRDLLRRV